MADRLLAHAADRAPRLVTSLYDPPEMVLSLPHRGRPGRKAGTSELALLPWPGIVVYMTEDEVVRIVRILHGAQRWP